MASVREIARKTGLSAATVSRALKAHPDVSDETRTLVFCEAQRSGYFNEEKCGGKSPAAIQRHCSSIGYVVPGDSKLYDYDWLLMDGVIEGLRQSRLDLRVIDLQRNKSHNESYTQFFTRSGLQGIVIRSALLHQAQTQEILDEEFPCVVVARKFENHPNVNFVWCDSGPETASAVEHLADLGHKRLALVVHRRPGSDHMDRQRGFMEACEARGIEFDSRMVIKIHANIEGGKTTFNRLMSLVDHPTAIVFTDPLTAMGALIRAQEVGLRIPDDLSIVGFDDGNQRHRVYPTLTAICQDTHEIGLEAGIWLGQKVNGQTTKPLRKVLHASLEINQTTGVPPKDSVRLAPNGTLIIDSCDAKETEAPSESPIFGG